MLVHRLLPSFSAACATVGASMSRSQTGAARRPPSKCRASRDPLRSDRRGEAHRLSSIKMNDGESATPLPPLYAGWMEALLGGSLPDESEATCDDCAMCP